jgi:hypothetical protein
MTDETPDLDALEAAAEDLRGMCSVAGYRDAVEVLMAATPALAAEVRRLRLTGEAIENGREYQRGRAESALAELGVLRAQRDAALAACDEAHYLVSVDAVRAALGVQPEPTDG